MVEVDVIAAGRIGQSACRNAAIKKAIAFAYEALSGDEGSAVGLSVRLVDVDEISSLHGAYFDDPSPTDVITFPFGDEPGSHQSYLGDIAICLDVASEQAVEAGHSVTREVVFLALHGLLHLLGHTDESDQSRAAMLGVQEELIAQYEQEYGRL